MAGSILELSQVKADFPALVEQLQAHLSTKNAWKGFLTTQTGETLLEFVAAVGALDQMRLLRYFQDAFPTTALSDTAVYAIASMQGVRINRKLPMSVDVSLSSPNGEVLIPELSQFSISGQAFFNRAPLVVTTVDSTHTLYEGTLISNQVQGLGTSYQTYLSKEVGFVVSDVDVKVVLNDVQLDRTLEGLWKFKGIPGYRDRTLPNGRLQLEFGNDLYGTMPNNNDFLTITYAVTRGLAFQEIKTQEKRVTIDTFPSVGGSATTNPTGGGDEPAADLYRNLSAASFGTFGSAVTKQQYLSTALSYPGVVDALTFSQREINPLASTWMNLVKVVLLTSTPWTTEKAAFTEYMQQRSMYSTRFFIEDPEQVLVDLDISLYCFPWANAEQCRIDALGALQTLFSRKEGQLGKDIYRSDVHNVALQANKGIEYVIIHSPTTDLLVSHEGIAAPSVSSGAASTGSIPVGTFYYAVTPVIAPYSGEIAPKNFTTFVNEVESTTLTIAWTPYEGATHYKIYGRTANGIGLIALLNATSTTSYIDDGVLTPTIGTPPTTTVPVRYLEAGTLTVRSYYSTRSGRSQPV